MNWLITTYLSYLAISIALTVWVARTLHKNGRIFLVDSFHGNESLADSVNHLLVVGFYLINIGYVALALKYGSAADTAQGFLEALSTKVGLVLVVLGFMHFFNLLVFNKMRKRAVTPPIAYHTPPPAAASTTAAMRSRRHRRPGFLVPFKECSRRSVKALSRVRP